MPPEAPLKKRKIPLFQLFIAAFIAVAAALLRQCGGSLVATSANLSGEKDAVTAAQVISALGSRVDVLLDGGPAQRRRPSTVVKCDGENWSILREGAIRRTTILRLLAPDRRRKARG